jgi:hypothetical protein
MPPQKKSKKNTSTKVDQEDHHIEEDNENSLTAETSQIIDQERQAKFEALKKARAEKTTHLLETHTEDEDDDDDAVDKQLEEVNKNVLMLQKEKENFAIQLEAKRKASEKLEKLNQAKEKLEKMQKEIDEMKEQENSSLWRDSPHQSSGQRKRIPKENFFTGNGISQFADPESPLSLGLQTAPWSLKYKPVSLPRYNEYGNFRQFLMSYEAAANSVGGDDVALAKYLIIACEGLVLNWYSLLPPHSICSWIDLKTKFIQAFQVFHETTTKPSDLYNCKQRDRDPL